VSARSPSHPRSPCLVGWIAAVALLTAVAVPAAVAAPSAPSVTSSPASPTNAATATFTWTESTPDAGYEIVGYEGGLDGQVADLGPAAGSAVRSLEAGTRTFRVRAVQEPLPILDPLAPIIPPQEPTGAFGSVTVVVDRTDPTLSVALSPSSPNGSNGWYRSPVRIDWTCSDAGGAGIASCPPDETVSSQGTGPRRTGRATDRAGNSSPSRTSPAFWIDSVAPNGGAMRTPTPGATVAPEPTFVWGPAPGGDTSGFDRYEVMVRIGGSYRAVARLSHTGAGEYRTTRQPSVYSQAFPNNTELRWYVRTYDRAGNAGGRESQSRAFRIDPTVPGPPAFTAGPNGPTNVAGPTFAWSGSHPSFVWEVSVAGTERVVVSGSGPQTQALLPPLPDGDYTFSVSQVTSFGARGVEATRFFQVDTVAPAAPVITARPPFPTTSATPGFAWTVEPGSYSRWRVVGPGGNALQTSDTPLPSTTVGPLGSGAYNFRVAQVDAAGNESVSAVEAFSIVGPATARRTGALPLPKQNAGRLRPRAGKTVLTRRPVLRWRGGPDATVYNLQVFRVLRTRTAGATPPVKKIYSVFPSKRRYRMPKAKIQPGTCYVWRVWPFVGTRFTSKPLGVSNFCIASAKVLRQKAEAKRRAARAR
jgi:hypothetical protein